MEKKFILDFIEVYRGLPALWQVKTKEYSNKSAKNAQYEILLQKYKEKYPNAEKKDVAQKVNSLRTAYRKELKRIGRLKKSSGGTDDESQPNLYYFGAIDFLRDNECVSQTTMNDDSGTKTCEQIRKRKKPDATEELMILAAKRLKQPPDEYAKIVESWAIKFKKLNEILKMYADKFINEILFEGQMGTLHRNSMQLNILSPSTTPQSYSNHYSSSPTPTFSCNSSNAPSTQVPVPQISPQIIHLEAEPTHNSTSIGEKADNSLTHYFSITMRPVARTETELVNFKSENELPAARKLKDIDRR